MEFEEKKAEMKEWISSDGLVHIVNHGQVMPELRYGAYFLDFPGAYPHGHGETAEKAVKRLLESIPAEIKKLEDLQAKLKEAFVEASKEVQE